MHDYHKREPIYVNAFLPLLRDTHSSSLRFLSYSACRDPGGPAFSWHLPVLLDDDDDDLKECKSLPTLHTHLISSSHIHIYIYLSIYTRTVTVVIVVVRRASLLATELCHLPQSPRTSARVIERKPQDAARPSLSWPPFPRLLIRRSCCMCRDRHDPRYLA